MSPQAYVEARLAAEAAAASVPAAADAADAAAADAPSGGRNNRGTTFAAIVDGRPYLALSEADPGDDASIRNVVLEIFLAPPFLMTQTMMMPEHHGPPTFAIPAYSSFSSRE